MLKISLLADPAEKKAEKQRKNQVEVEVVLAAHPITTTALDTDHPLTVLLALPI